MLIIPRRRVTTPSVVTSGLILNLDAGNSASYPGSGTTWFNTAGSNNGTLTNGPTYSAANGGGIVCDGINDYVNFTTPPSLTNQITLEVWANLTLDGTYRHLAGREQSYRIICRNDGFQFVLATANNGWYSSAGNYIISGTALSGLNSIICTYNGSNLFAYVNGVPIGQTTSAISGNIVASNPYHLMGSTAGGAAAYSLGTMHVNRVYNRALSAAEVRQNFDALRGRFGI
jgi:hypothetical protein